MSEETPKFNEEQAKQEISKEDAFKENPDYFIDIRSLVVATRRNESGQIETLVNPATRAELLISQGEVMRAIHNTITYNEIQQAKDKERIVKPTFTSRIKGAFGK